MKNQPLYIVLFLFHASTGCTTVPPEAVESPPTCAITYSGNSKPESFRGVRLNPIYRVDVEGNASPDSEADSRNAADLFNRLHELPLGKMPPCVSEVYRLTWVPSFHRITTVRIWMSEDGYFISTKRLERTADNKNGSEFTETHRKISISEWETVRNAVENFNFWQVAPTENEAMPHDGAAWLIEGMKGGRFHTVFRIGPDLDFERLIRKVFAMSGETTEIDLYLNAESAS